MTDGNNGATYAQAGVDIDAGNALVIASNPQQNAQTEAALWRALVVWGAFRS